jgi:arginase
MSKRDFRSVIRNIHIIAVPYDSGRRGERMGAGPLRLLDDGIADELRAIGCDVAVDVLELPAGFWPGEVTSAFHLANLVGQSVRQARRTKAFPLILSGNCGPAAFGAIAGLGSNAHVFWFDAHGDFNTPETTASGFMDGTSLAALCGRCWTSASKTVEGFVPVGEESVLLIGARDLDAAEVELLQRSAVTRLNCNELAQHLPDALRNRSGRDTYLHIDLDVLDPSEGRVNQYSAAHGLTVLQMDSAISQIAGATNVGAAAITAYDPAADREGVISAKAIQLVQTIMKEVR